MMLNKGLFLSTVVFLGLALTSVNGFSSEVEPKKAGNLALEKLIEGNKRYLAGQSTCGWTRKPSDKERREQLFNTQKPFAIILGCSDSRVPPEIIFDQRLGDLFVIRVAGNVIDDVVLGSIEYAVEHLSPVPLLLVLGHERCGAVAAAVHSAHYGHSEKDHIASIIRKITPIVKQAEKMKGKDLLDDAVTLNVQTVVKQLNHATPYLREAVKNNKLTIVGARYDMDGGTIKVVTQ